MACRIGRPLAPPPAPMLNTLFCPICGVAALNWNALVGNAGFVGVALKLNDVLEAGAVAGPLLKANAFDVSLIFVPKLNPLFASGKALLAPNTGVLDPKGDATGADPFGTPPNGDGVGVEPLASPPNGDAFGAGLVMPPNANGLTASVCGVPNGDAFASKLNAPVVSLPKAGAVAGCVLGFALNENGDTVASGLPLPNTFPPPLGAVVDPNAKVDVEELLPNAGAVVAGAAAAAWPPNEKTPAVCVDAMPNMFDMPVDAVVTAVWLPNTDEFWVRESLPKAGGLAALNV